MRLPHGFDSQVESESPWNQRTTSPSSGCLVVVVDDDVDNLRSMAELLLDAGHCVSIHFSPASAIDFLRSKPCDVLLSDVHMPEMTGLQLAALVRDNRPEMQVILMSGEHVAADEIDAEWRFFRKPVEFSSIRRAIADFATK